MCMKGDGRMSFKRILALLCAVCLVGCIMAGCSSDGADNPTETTEAVY